MRNIRPVHLLSSALVGLLALSGATFWMVAGSAAGAAGSAPMMVQWSALTITCNASPQRLSYDEFVEGPGGVFDMQHVISGTCLAAVHTLPNEMTLNDAPTGTYEVGLVVLSPASVSVTATAQITVGVNSVTPPTVTGGGTGNVQAVSTFVFRNRLFGATK